MTRLLSTVVGLMLVAAALACGEEGEWSRFRGPNGSGISQAATVPVRWTEADYNWKVELPGAGHSSPVVWKERVFVTGSDADSARRTIVCLDVADGHTLWRRDEPSRTYRQHRDNSYASATPAVDAAGVVLTWTSPEQVLVVAWNLEGQELWRRDLGPFVGVQGSGSSPILFDGLVVLASDQEDPSLIPGHKTDPPAPVGKSSILALDRATGEIRWQSERRTSFASYATPCVFQPEEGPVQLIFTNTANGISGVDPQTGKLLWEFGAPFLDRVVSSPVVAGELIIAGHGAGLRASRYIAVRPDRQAGAATLAYEIERSLPLVPTPLAHEGRLFLWGDDGVVACLRLADGETIWRERVGGAYYGSPVWVDRRLYCISRSGEVVVLAAADRFEELARVPLGEASYATPAVAGGTMYLRTLTHLFSLGSEPDKQAGP